MAGRFFTVILAAAAITLGISSHATGSTSRMEVFPGCRQVVEDYTMTSFYPSQIPYYGNIADVNLGEVQGRLATSLMDTTTLELDFQTIGLISGNTLPGPVDLALFFSRKSPFSSRIDLEDFVDEDQLGIANYVYTTTTPPLPRNEIDLGISLSLHPRLTMGILARSGYISEFSARKLDFSTFTYSSTLVESALYGIRAGFTFWNPGGEPFFETAFEVNRFDYTHRLNDEDDDPARLYTQEETVDGEILKKGNARLVLPFSESLSCVPFVEYEAWDFDAIYEITGTDSSDGYKGGFSQPMPKNEGYDVTRRSYYHSYIDAGIGFRQIMDNGILIAGGASFRYLDTEMALINSDGDRLESIASLDEWSPTLFGAVEIRNLPGYKFFDELVFRSGLRKSLHRVTNSVQFIDDYTPTPNGDLLESEYKTVASSPIEFTLGLGAKLENLSVDLLFNYRLFFSGGFMFSGKGEIPFPMISMNYNF